MTATEKPKTFHVLVLVGATANVADIKGMTVATVMVLLASVNANMSGCVREYRMLNWFGNKTCMQVRVWACEWDCVRWR